MSCHLYVIGQRDNPATCKIGIANKPTKRLAQLQGGSPSKLVIHATFRAKDRSEALDWEKNAHELFANDRLNGEWFSVDCSAIEDRKNEWMKRRPKPVSKPVLSLPKSGMVGPDSQPLHPEVPHELAVLCICQMSEGQRREFWSCFELDPPPPEFDDWYLIGSDVAGFMGAFAVEGFVHRKDCAHGAD